MYELLVFQPEKKSYIGYPQNPGPTRSNQPQLGHFGILDFSSTAMKKNHFQALEK